jgi:hypothetical protein
MTKQDLQQIIEDLNQLVNSTEGNYVKEPDILDAIYNDRFKTNMLDILVRNNIPYTLCRISMEITDLAHRIYELEDYVDFEEKYLNKTLRTLDDFKLELQRILEYINLLKQANALDVSRAKYRETVLEGAHMYDYKCSSNNIRY